eukprot:SAG31_NODE_28666_length_406_cov_3.013029_1_plen_56_part_10
MGAEGSKPAGDGVGSGGAEGALRQEIDTLKERIRDLEHAAQCKAAAADGRGGSWHH